MKDAVCRSKDFALEGAESVVWEPESQVLVYEWVQGDGYVTVDCDGIEEYDSSMWREQDMDEPFLVLGYVTVVAVVAIVGV